MAKKIFVTQPSLPDLEEFIEYLKDIWESKWLTNEGKYHNALEEELSYYLGVPYVSLFTNGTIALLTALHALHISGEVITTPFSFVATTHALWWNRNTPIFVDIEPKSCNLDPVKIESAITPGTTAILPVHIYGNPCNVEKIQKIADTFGLRVIYDAAHAFGVNYKGQSLLNYGDLSIISFHATKIFHTFEGGAIICHDKKTKERLDQLRNFGIIDEVTVVAPGINAKMNELQAVMGLLQLKHYSKNLAKRKNIAECYKSELQNISGLKIMHELPEVEYNYGYFPIFINKKLFGKSRDDIYDELKKHEIFTRRYFYPLISNLPIYQNLSSARRDNLMIANKIADSVLCLPIYSELKIETAINICSLIKSL